MMKTIFSFAKEDDGNTTIDWTVLVAGLVALGFAIAASIGNSTAAVTANTASAMDSISVNGS